MNCSIQVPHFATKAKEDAVFTEKVKICSGSEEVAFEVTILFHLLQQNLGLRQQRWGGRKLLCEKGAGHKGVGD